MLCVIVVRSPWIICCFIILVVVFCFSVFWGFMGLTKNGTRFSFWLVELVGEAFFRHLEFSSIVFDIVYTEGA